MQYEGLICEEVATLGDDAAREDDNILFHIKEHVRELVVYSRALDHCARLVIVKANVVRFARLLVKITAQLLCSACDRQRIWQARLRSLIDES